MGDEWVVCWIFGDGIGDRFVFSFALFSANGEFSTGLRLDRLGGGTLLGDFGPAEDVNCGANPEGVPGTLDGSEGTGGGGDAARGVIGRSLSFFPKRPRRLRRVFRLCGTDFELSSKSVVSCSSV
jgi:hypothetical protein